MENSPTLTSALAALRDDLREARPPDPANPSRLPLTAIKVAASAFQPRALEDRTGQSEAHVKRLMEAIRITPGHLITPLVVWWSGRGWYTIDGHHRLWAYRRLARLRRGPINVAPRVVPFEGTLEEALTRSLADNSRDKLAMTKDEKMDGAWRAVCLTELSKRQIVQIAGVSEKSVANMRRARKELIEAGTFPVDKLPELPWKQAYDLSRGHEISHGEDWMERQAEDWAKKLGRAFADKPRSFPDVFAMALEKYSRSLAQQLPEALRGIGIADSEDVDEFDEFDEVTTEEAVNADF